MGIDGQRLVCTLEFIASLLILGPEFVKMIVKSCPSIATIRFSKQSKTRMIRSKGLGEGFESEWTVRD